MKAATIFENALGISMIICRNQLTNKYLVIQQTDGTWWVPGGKVDAPETFAEAAVRECREQAGIDVQVKGVLRMEHNIQKLHNFVRIKGIIYAQPIDPKQKTKDIADQQSIQSKYLSLEEILALRKKWRDDTIFVWFKYLEQGGKVYPLSMLEQTVID